MAKLTKVQHSTLQRALNHAEKARAYVHSENVALCTRRVSATTTLDYTRSSDGSVLYEVERAYGSDLVQLDTAIKELGSFLALN